MDDFSEKEIDEALLESREGDFKRAFRIQGKKPKVCYDIATHLTDKYWVKTISGKKMREVFTYREGVYVPGEDTLRKEVQELLEELCTTHHSKEIIEIIKNRTVMDRKEFSVDKNLINLSNGVLDIRTGEIAPHDPKHLFFTKIPVDYIEGADCPKIKKFLSEILESDAVPIIQEWFGYCLYRSYFIKKAIVFVGDGDTGKTTLLNLLERFIGKENVSGVSLQKLVSDKFAAANMYNKHLNSYDDLPFKDIGDNGAFKIATGGGSISGEFKFGDQFRFENYAKLTYACNKIPDVKDANDAAYFGRWIIVHFRNEVADPDKFLIDKLTTPEELSGLLNCALEGLKRLLANQEFNYRKEPHEIKREMELSGSVVAQFAHHCLEEAPGHWISKDAMHEAFVKYARTKKLPAYTKEYVGKKLRNYASYITDGKSLELNPLTGKKEQVTGWRNVEIKADTAGTDPAEPSEDELNTILNEEHQQEAEQQALLPQIS